MAISSSQSQQYAMSSQRSVASQHNYPPSPRGEATDDEQQPEQSGESPIAPIPINLPDSGSEDKSSDDDDDSDDESEVLSPAELINRMESLVEVIVEAMDQHKLPELSTYSSRHRRRKRTHDSLLHASKNKKRRIVFHNLQQSRIFANVLLVLSFCHTLLLAQRTTTTREVYYFYVTHFRSQKECDAAIVETAKLLRVPRSSLGLYASPKGWFCGCIQVIQNGRVVLDGQALSSLQGAPITQEWLKPNRDFTIDCQVHPKGGAEGEDEDDPSSQPAAPRRAKCILVIEKEGKFTCFFLFLPGFQRNDVSCNIHNDLRGLQPIIRRQII